MSTGEDAYIHYYEVLDWNSSPQKIELALEIPFWILAADHRYEVTVNEHTLTIETVNSGISIQGGNEHTRTHQYQRFFGRIPPQDNDRPRYKVIDLLRGANIRYTKTQLWISTSAASDAVAALREDGIRERISREYFASLAKAHLPFVNQLINGYRAATYDPYATELTEFDVPVWFLVLDGSLTPIYLMDSLCQDTFPVIGEFGSSNVNPVFLESPDVLSKSIQAPLVPGEAELLDAWSLCYRGRFSECIRSAVTAVEVLLEERLRKSLEENSFSKADIEDRLTRTKNRFQLRLDDYCRVSGRCVPGPTLSHIPYLNGLRLREQFEQTRKLRHDVVHRGERLDPSLKNPIRRAVETTTWLFSWLAEEAEVGRRQAKHYTLFEAWRGSARMKWQISSQGVFVGPIMDPESVRSLLNDDDSEPPQCLADLPEARTIESIDVAEVHDAIFRATLNRFPDFEHFVLMAFAKLGFDSAVDVFQDPDVERTRERWQIESDQQPIFVFLWESVNEFHLVDYEEMWEAVKFRRVESNIEFEAVVIVHELKDLDWTSHASKPIQADIHEKAKSDHVAIIRADDLARFASAARNYEWQGRDVRIAFSSPGWSRLPPLNSMPLGTVKRLFPKIQVLSVQLNGSCEVSLGNLLYVRLRERFVGFQVQSIQEEGSSISTARSGRIGICFGTKVSIERTEVPDDAEVFIGMEKTGGEPNIAKSSRLQQMLNGQPPVY